MTELEMDEAVDEAETEIQRILLALQGRYPLKIENIEVDTRSIGNMRVCILAMRDVSRGETIARS